MQAQLTDKEAKFLEFCEKYLRPHVADGFSDLSCSDVSYNLDMDQSIAKGVLGSLCKKKLLKIVESEPNRPYIYLHETQGV